MGYRNAIIALVLGLIGFVLFVGAENTVTENGVVTSHSRLNFAGIILAVIGLIMAIRVLLRRPAAGALLLAILALVVCVVQLAHSTGIYMLPIGG